MTSRPFSPPVCCGTAYSTGRLRRVAAKSDAATYLVSDLMREPGVTPVGLSYNLRRFAASCNYFFFRRIGTAVSCGWTMPSIKLARAFRAWAFSVV